MASLRSILFQDLGTKALALILGLAIYVHVFSGQEREFFFRVPLSVSPLPKGLAFGGDPPADLRVRIRGTGADLIKLAARRIHAEVKVDDPREGIWQRPLQGSDIKLPHGVRPALVEVVEPKSLHLSIEREVTSLVPVAIRLRDPVPVERALSHAPTVDPPAVRLTGPRSHVAGVDSVATLPIHVADWSSVRQVRGHLQVPAGLTADRETVTVHFYTEARKTRAFHGVRVELLPPYADRALWVRPDTGTVEVSAGESFVDRVDADRVRLVADTRNLQPGGRRVALRAVIPGAVGSVPAFVRARPESVSVRIR